MAMTSYEDRELSHFRSELAQAETGTLAERREAAADFLDDLRKRPEIVGERIEWLSQGQFGHGAQAATLKILNSPRMNHAAWLLQAVAALDWHVPQRLAIEAWKKLSPAEKTRLAGEIESAIASSRTERDHSRARAKSSARGPARARSLRPFSAAQRAFVARKVPLLLREGYPPKQAFAIAYRMAEVAPRRAATKRRGTVKRRAASKRRA